MEAINLISKNTEETQRIGEMIAGIVWDGAVIALTGALAAGKTVLSRGIFSFFGLADDFSSPSYTIINEYAKQNISAYHMDVYRISDESELDYTGYEDCIKNGVITVIEWADIIQSRVPKDALHIDIKMTDTPDERIIKISNIPCELYASFKETLCEYSCD